MKIKKISRLMLALCVTMTFSACGGKEKAVQLEKISTEELCTQIMNQSDSVKGVEAKTDVDIELKAFAMEQEYKVFLKGNVLAAATLEPTQTHIQTDLEYYALGTGGTIKSDVYALAEEDRLKVYMLDTSSSNKKQEKEWQFFTQDISEYSDKIGELENNILNFQSEEWKEFFSKAETTIEDSMYKLTLELQNTMFRDILEKESIDISDKVDMDEMPEFTMTISLYVDGSTYQPKKLAVDADMESFAFGKTTFELTKFDVKVTIPSYEDKIEIVVPEEAKQAEK